MKSSSDVHPTALVSTKAQLGRHVTVGPFTVVHDNVVIGDGSTIGGHCEIGVPAHHAGEGGPLEVGSGSMVRSHSVLYENSTIGPGLVTGHRVTIRERAIIGRDFQLGTLGDVQGHCEIGDFVRFHSNVHVGHHTKVGSFVWIFPYVVLTNDPHPPSEVQQGVTVEDYAAIATMSVVLPGVLVGEGALVGAHSSVTRDVPANMVAVGVPAKIVCEATDIMRRDASGKPAYPWRRHFHRGYPSDVVARWTEEFPDE